MFLEELEQRIQQLKQIISEKEIVERLCQKDYDQKVLLAAQKELKQLEKLYYNYTEKTCEAIYQKSNEERKKLVQPISLSDKGERVRSKTEILIANALYKNDVPYRYEAPLRLNYYGIIQK